MPFPSSTIIHPNFEDKLTRLFRQTAAVQQSTDTTDEYGDITQSWTAVSGLSAVAAQVARVGGSSKRYLPEFIQEVATHQVTFPEAYAQITPKMRIVVGSNTYEIMYIHVDSQSATTSCYVRETST